MSSSRVLAVLTTLTGLNLALTSSAWYNLHDHHVYNLEEHEARMDELEGTLRPHIGVTEESLERIEKSTSADGKRDAHKGEKTDELYAKRGRDEKGKK